MRACWQNLGIVSRFQISCSIKVFTINMWTWPSQQTPSTLLWGRWPWATLATSGGLHAVLSSSDEEPVKPWVHTLSYRRKGNIKINKISLWKSEWKHFIDVEVHTHRFWYENSWNVFILKFLVTQLCAWKDFSTASQNVQGLVICYRVLKLHMLPIFQLTVLHPQKQCKFNLVCKWPR